MNTGAVKSWNKFKQTAREGFGEGILILGTIAVIESGNSVSTINGINSAEAGRAAQLLRDAAFARVSLLTVRAFDRITHSDDKHLRCSIEYIRQQGVLGELVDGEQQDNLTTAIQMFDKIAARSSLARLRHQRNKELAHIGEYGEILDRPKIDELFSLARGTAKIWERLAWGVGLTSTSIEFQTDAYKESAKKFWSPWG